MNILIYSVNPQSPHLETDLELALKFKDRGDKVTIVRCLGQLKSCLVNPEHNMLVCGSCRSKYNNAISISGLSGVDMVTLPLVKTSYESIPGVFSDVDDLRAFTFRGLDIGFSAASTLIGRLNDHRFDTIRFKKEVAAELKMSIDVVLGMEKVLADVKPDEVYLFNGRFSSHNPLQALCIKHNIVYYTHERAGILNKYIVRKNTMPHNFEYGLRELRELWESGGDDKVQIGSKFFTDRRNRVVQSWVSFTESQKKGLLPLGFDKEKKNIVIYNSTMAEYEGMEIWKNPIYKDENDGIVRILESFKGECDYVFYLRVHPSMKLQENTQTRSIDALEGRFKNLRLIRAEEECDSYALMDSANKVICFGSTVGAEATFWSKVSILLGKSLYMNIDACYEPASHEELVAMIKNDHLLPKPQINAVKYGYWDLMRGVYFERFRQLSLFSMSYRDKIIEPDKFFAIVEKILKLRRIRNKRDWHDLIKKVQNLIGWK